MAFAQTQYGQHLGTGPYTIADAGCFLTAFANLLQRLGEGVDPPTLNQYFIDHGTYSHDSSEAPGTADNLGYGSISAYDNNITVTGTGGAGWPSSNDAIVKFIFKSVRSGQIISHFCLVADANARTIVDSYDGVVKQSVYGTPVGWATYERHVPQPITPPAPAEQPAFTVESIPEVTKQLRIDTHIWDLNQRSWPGMANNPVGSGSAGTQFKTTAIARHILGGAYYLPEGSTTQGYNLVDCQDPAAPVVPVVVEPVPVEAPAPAPVAGPPYASSTVEGVEFTSLNPDMKKMYIVKQGGAEKWNFKGVSEWGGFKSVQHLEYGSVVYINGTAYHPLGARYEVTSNDWNGFEANGQPNVWAGFNLVDLSEKKPPEIEPVPAPTPVASAAPAAPIETAPIVTTEPVATTSPIDWQTSYRPFASGEKYIATRTLVVEELSGKNKSEELPAFDANSLMTPNRGVVRAFGTVFKDGIQYYRLRTNNDPNFNYWYCVPVVDAKTKTANLLPYPTAPASVPTSTETAHDILTVTFSGFEKALRAILPMWFKSKK